MNGVPNVLWCEHCEDTRVTVKWVGTRDNCVKRKKGEIKDSLPSGADFEKLWAIAKEAKASIEQVKRQGGPVDKVAQTYEQRGYGEASQLSSCLLIIRCRDALVFALRSSTIMCCSNTDLIVQRTPLLLFGAIC